jgi:hypothetical protein
LHAVQDHNLDEHSIATTIVNSAAGILRPDGRFTYGLIYQVGGVGLIAVEVIESRSPSNEPGDQEGLGVVTAYCRGMDRCPDEVDRSIEQSTGR